jgi:hypothetical protein
MSNPDFNAERPLPTIYPGTMIEVGPDGSMDQNKVQFGFVDAVCDGRHPRGHTYVNTEGGLKLVPYRTLVHVDDPELHRRLDGIREDPHVGAYRLSHTEVSIRRLRKAIEDLESEQSVQGRNAQDVFDVLEHRLAEVEGQISNLGVAKRKPGRPSVNPVSV